MPRELSTAQTNVLRLVPHPNGQGRQLGTISTSVHCPTGLRALQFLDSGKNPPPNRPAVPQSERKPPVTLNMQYSNAISREHTPQNLMGNGGWTGSARQKNQGA